MLKAHAQMLSVRLQSGFGRAVRLKEDKGLPAAYEGDSSPVPEALPGSYRFMCGQRLLVQTYGDLRSQSRGAVVPLQFPASCNTVR